MKNTKDKTNSFIDKIKSKCPLKCTKIKELFKKNKKIVIGVLIVGAAFLVGFFLKGLFIAAIVNGRPISRFKVIRQLEKYQGAGVLDSLVTEELVRQEARKKNIKVTEEEIKAEVSKIESEVIAQGQNLDELLKLQNMTRKDLETNLTLNKLIEKILADKITVSDEEVQSYIDQNKSSFAEGTDMEQAKTLVKQQLLQEKLSSEYQSWIDEVRAAAKVRTVVKY